jgi:hypothetical protein
MEEKRIDEELYTDEISELVEEAHAIFNATTVSEVMDMRDRQSQEDFLNEIYSNPGVETINSYLDVVERLRPCHLWWVSGCGMRPVSSAFAEPL